MKTILPVPTGNLLPFKEVKIDLELTGEQHDRLLMGNEDLYERVVASVMDELIDKEHGNGLGQAYNLPLRVLISYFMMVKAQSISPDWEITWSCNKKKTEGHSEVECGCQNSTKVGLSSFPFIEIPENYKYPHVTISAENGGTYDVFVKYLSTKEEFIIMDYFLEQGVKKEDLFVKNDVAFKYFRRRFLTALCFSGDNYTDLSIEEKDNILKKSKVPAAVLSQLYGHQSFLDRVGYDVKPIRVRCKECAGVSNLQLPLSAGLLVPTQRG